MYTYIFGVRTEISKKLDLELELDFLLEYDDDDIDRICMAMKQLENEMWESTTEKALNLWDKNNIANQIYAIKMRSKFDTSISIHKFSSNEKLDRESISYFIEEANSNKETKKLLIERKIKL